MHRFAGSTRETPSRRPTTAQSGVGITLAPCDPPNFFVSTSVETFFLDLLPPPLGDGFCIADGGTGDLEPATGTIKFVQTVSSARRGIRVFSGTATRISGTAVPGGITGFGVTLTDFNEITIAGPPAIAGDIFIPIFVQGSFGEGIPPTLNGLVTTHIDGDVRAGTNGFLFFDIGSWAGLPVVAAGHVIQVRPPMNLVQPDATSPPASGAIGPPAAEVVNLEVINTNRLPGGWITLPTSASAIVSITNQVVAPNQGFIISLDPFISANPVGGMHTVTATVFPPPPPGATVEFVVQAGPNAGLTSGLLPFGPGGVRSWTYTSNGQPGVDLIDATARFIIFPAVPVVLVSRQVVKEWIGDANPPSCRLTTTTPSYIDVTVQDRETGLATIQVLKSVNATVNVPPFFAGTRSPVVVRATKIDLTKTSNVELQITDVFGNVTRCDPALLTLTSGGESPERLLLDGVPAAEHLVTIDNGTPGLRRISITANGIPFLVSGLRDGETRNVDIESALKSGQSNRVELIGYGPRRATATILLWDGGSPGSAAATTAARVRR